MQSNTSIGKKDCKAQNAVKSRCLEVDETKFYKFKLICTSGNSDLKNSPRRQISVGESNQNVFLIQRDAYNFADFEISEFEISRFDCGFFYSTLKRRQLLEVTRDVLRNTFEVFQSIC